ncbi:MAG: arginyltransferase [Myxococcaceae bacterium]|nr:arginyltransferase [Myxococcaceae bacterium]MCI0672841.1 arginyltransferase [Myxococcaceae bacterium]
MALLLHHEVESPRACSYLPEASASLEHLLLKQVSPEELEAMLVRGWRRFGPAYFRPACQACGECVSLRIPTDTFRPTRAQRKARNRCARFRREVGTPKVDAARLALYREWHGFREDARGWEPSPLTQKEYALQFSFPHPCARELTWWDDEASGGPRLVAVGLCDETPRAWSAAYFFYAPDLAHLSPGTANVVFQVELARERGIPHVYLGYRVRGCASLRYKETFHPHELLEGRPAFHAPPRWVRVEEAPGEPSP